MLIARGRRDLIDDDAFTQPGVGAKGEDNLHDMVPYKVVAVALGCGGAIAIAVGSKEAILCLVSGCCCCASFVDVWCVWLLADWLDDCGCSGLAIEPDEGNLGRDVNGGGKTEERE